MALSGQGSFLDTAQVVSALSVAPGMHAADLGCGSGFFTIALARAVGASGVVSAVDVQEGPLEATQGKAEAAGLGNVRLIRADLEVPGSTGIPDHSQDIVFLAHALFQSTKRVAMVGEGARILKQGGQFVIIERTKEMSEDEVKGLAEQSGLRFQKPMSAGAYSFGLLFTKP